MEDVCFENRYIAFLDVLGFKEMLNESKNDLIKNYIEGITSFDALSKLRNYDFTKKEFKNGIPDLEFVTVSDSTIITTIDSPAGLRLILEFCQLVQTNLLLSNIYIRGAISYGERYYNQELNIMLGKGIVQAYNLEKAAILPRIIIDPKIIQHNKLNKELFIDKHRYSTNTDKLIHSYHEKSNKSLDHNAFFVDYLDNIIGSFIASTNTTLSDKIISNLMHNLYSSQSVYEKFLWLKDYFLETIYDYRNSPTLHSLRMKNSTEFDRRLQNLNILKAKIEIL